MQQQCVNAACHSVFSDAGGSHQQELHRLSVMALQFVSTAARTAMYMPRLLHHKSSTSGDVTAVV